MGATTRQRTRVAVLVHSHQNPNALDISLDVIELSCTKSIKGAGSFTLTLVPRRNYFNYLFPNDVVNIYIDPGDGERGFVRTMMGYIDRVGRTEQVNEETGALSTYIRVSGTDFSKAFDRTEVYFNPALANRAELIDPQFGSSLLGEGSALRTRGIQAFGTPADMVENLLTLLMGFGKQWVMPKSYPTGFVEQRRNTRRQRALSRIPTDIIHDLQTLGFAAIGTQNEVDNLLGSGSSIEQALLDKLKQQTGADITDTPTADQVAKGFGDKQQLVTSILQASSALQAYQAIARDTQTGTSVVSLLDVLELGFIEAMTIDGFITATPVWSQQGPLSSILYGFSNEIVNELCFDLRPVVDDVDDGVFGRKYSKTQDELGINVNGTSSMPPSVSAVQYTPAVVFREYPFSVVEGLDLSRFNVLNQPVGFVPFGPVFAVGANDTAPGRKLFQYQDALTPETCAFPATSKPIKHIDVVPIRNTDVTGSDVGRSDHDVFNLFAVYANDALQQIYKFLLQDILPVVTPVSIARHGLRVRELNTRFANYARDQLCHTGGSAVDTSTVRRNIIRWSLLIDHWNQHNIEYLSGTISLRGMPEIRVGYRLDWVDRHESYYVEQVSHTWKYPGAFMTQVQVSRGQRNDPFAAYIPPIMAKQSNLPAGHPEVRESNIEALKNNPTLLKAAQDAANQDSASVARQGGGNRSKDGRLADYFEVVDTRATALSSQNRQNSGTGVEGSSNLENGVDERPNADRGQAAIYAWPLAAPRDGEVTPADISAITAPAITAGSSE